MRHPALALAFLLGAAVALGPACEGGPGDPNEDLPGTDPDVPAVRDDGPRPDTFVPAADPGGADEAGPRDLPPEVAPPGRLDVSPRLLDFGMNAIDVPVQRSLTLTSAGAGPVTVIRTRFDGTDAALFRLLADGAGADLAGGTALTLAPEENAQVEVGFVFQGTKQAVAATLVFETDGDPAEVAVPLSGLGEVGFDCRPVFVPALVTFGKVPVGSSQDRPIALVNEGNGQCDLYQVKLQACAVDRDSGVATCDEPGKGTSSASFTLADQPPAGAPLLGRQSWTMTVRYAPRGDGPVAALVGAKVRDPLTGRMSQVPEPGPDGTWPANVRGEGVLDLPP